MRRCFDDIDDVGVMDLITDHVSSPSVTVRPVLKVDTKPECVT